MTVVSREKDVVFNGSSLRHSIVCDPKVNLLPGFGSNADFFLLGVSDIPSCDGEGTKEREVVDKGQ